jgi:hypothetical protein
MPSQYSFPYPYPYPESIQSSLHILGFPENTPPLSLKELNKRYHLLALRHHPDKLGRLSPDEHKENADENDEHDSTEKFKEINDAHKRILNYFYSSHGETGKYNTDIGYDSILQLFINTILVKMSSSSANTDAIQTLIHQIITKGIQSAIKMFRSMDKHAIITIYDILSKHQELFGISRDTLDELTTIMEEKTSGDIVIHVNPSLLDMLLDRVYILQECGHTYYIPLWHSELHFKIKGTTLDDDADHYGEVIVLCDPELPENVTIDDNNNIYISLDVNICDLFREQVLPVFINDEIKINGFIYYIHASDVTLRTDTTQCVLLHGCGGIAAMNNTAKHTTDIYKVDKRSNVYANIRLVM